MKLHERAVMQKVQHSKNMKRKWKVSAASTFEDDSHRAGEHMDQHKNGKLKKRRVTFKDEPTVISYVPDTKKQKPDKDVKRVRKLQLREANEEEDKIINRLAKVLGISKRRKKEKKSAKKIPSVFANDGLDYILEVLDGPDNMMEKDLDLNEDLPPEMGSTNSRSPRAGGSKWSDKKVEGERDSEEDMMSGGSHSSVEESEMSDTSNVDDESENDDQDDDLELQSNGSVKSDEEFDESADSDVEAKKSNNKKQKPKIWEDIYGRLRDEKGNILPNPSKASQVYVPPHQQMKQEPISDERKVTLERIKRQLKGLINRLSESNINPISSEIEGMYMKNSRNDMNETLLSILCDVLVSPVSVPPRFALEQAMLIALLHGNVGSEIGAFFLQNLALKFDGLLKTGRNCEQGKECSNILTFLCHLYNFKATHSLLIFDVFKLLVESFQEIDIELILLVLKHSGFTLRKDDPLTFKEVLLSVQSKASSLKPEQNQSRVNFMLDILIEVRNNNMEKMKKLLSYDPSITEHLKKVLRGLVRKGSYIQELSISYDDLLKANERGRWWIVGSAWYERSSEHKEDLKNDANPLEDHSVSDRILHLAKKLHINTETRKVVFGIIMTAQDYMSAFESLLRLKLKNQQEKEIISVLLYCCLQEKTFNPYYAFLSSQFCKFDRRFRGHLKFSLWDKFKELESMKASQRNCLASLLVHLFTTESLDISVLKVIQFSEMNKTMVQFFRKILTGILLHEKEEICSKVFQRVASNKNLHLLRESLRLFMHHFILRRKSQVDHSVAEKLTQRVKIAEDALNSAKHAFKL